MPSPGKKTTRAPEAQTGTKEIADSNLAATFPIVGVGASAGGLEAFSSLLRALPPDPGLALVFLPHLDPTHESAMVELLSRTTRLTVRQAANGMRVSHNVLYVLPPNSDLTISNGVLHLVEREATRGHHMPIDSFFRALAADQTTNAVGVILSGTATDGTLGLAAIKSDGGITFAQDSESAKYDGMPTSAIAAGVVDFVLPPHRIAEELIRIQRQPTRHVSVDDPFDGRDALLKDVFRLLRSFSRVDFSDYKVATIRRRIIRRMNLHQVVELSDYVKLLHRDQKEVEALYRDVLINVTSFFRNPEVFESLREIVYPKILVRRADPVRIWVPGCSTGEETYSHAIALLEASRDRRQDVPAQIFGTDLSETAIQHARIGIYKPNIVNEVSKTRLRRFFSEVSNGYQVSKVIRDMCVFARQNVFGDPPFSHMDLISCRNVLIYLSPVLQKKIIPIFHYALRPAGFLLVGNSEGLLGSGAEIFDLVDRRSKIYQKKPVPSPVTFSLAVPSIEPAGIASDKGSPVHKQEEQPKPALDVQREADRLLLTKYVPAAVVVNGDLDILQSRGRTAPYLELPVGKASLNLMKMVRPGLQHELRALIEKARKDSVRAVKENLVFEEGLLDSVRVEVIPFSTPAHDQHHFLVLFEDTSPIEARPAVRKSPKEVSDAKSLLISQLKQELAATKEYLQSIIEAQGATNEELQSANEEIQSGNEELQSTNEELQTSKEELESANEELNTVNEEIHIRNQQLGQLNNDLINLLNSATLPMVMLGDDLRIRRYTPEAEKIFGFSGRDLGKPFTRLSLNLDVSQLERCVLDVMRDFVIRGERIQARDGSWYKLRITPYRTMENKIDGVVVALFDITDVVDDKPARTGSHPDGKE